MSDDLFIEYALRYLLIPGQRAQALEVIERAGLNPDLPQPIIDLLAYADRLNHTHLIITEADPLLMQWNPFSGSSPLYTSGAFGVQLLNNHRWMQGMHEAMIKTLYHTIHETAHAVWAALGLRGLLTALPAHQRGEFHALAEASAVYLGDLECHRQLIESDYFESIWPSGAYQTHAAAFSPLLGLKACGLKDAEMADWLFSLYLDGGSDLPHLTQHKGLRAEALAFFSEELAYATKVDLNTTPQWIRHYWERPEIEEFLFDFVPPNPILLPEVERPISTIEACRSHWKALLTTPRWSPPAERYQLTRLHVQRVALKICELLGVFASYRLQTPDDHPHAGQRALQVTHTARAQLLDLFKTSFLQGDGQLSSRDAQEITETVEQIRAQLQLGLSELFGPVLLLTHPHIDSLPFQDIAPPLIDPLLASEDDPEREQSELISTCQLVFNEAKTALLHLRGSAFYSTQYQTLKEVALTAHALIGALTLGLDPEQNRAATQWLIQLKKQRLLWLPYPISWMDACPFVDPLIGFRYR